MWAIICAKMETFTFCVGVISRKCYGETGFPPAGQNNPSGTRIGIRIYSQEMQSGVVHTFLPPGYVPSLYCFLCARFSSVKIRLTNNVNVYNGLFRAPGTGTLLVKTTILFCCSASGISNFLHNLFAVCTMKFELKPRKKIFQNIFLLALPG